ncbi:5-deoxy-glucuronate isomerase [Streptomyces sp. NPDC057253]|uniref:5-deoxy-glucuronate isomerase n=1 Tax=Streptomyces sp. NPDC057253 TaxID=3346069 RepID=UPI00363FC0D1
MSRSAKYVPKGTSTDGPYGLLVTPDSAGWGYSGLRVLTLVPGGEHVLSTGESEFLVLPLTGSCTVTTGGSSFELVGRTDVFASVTDFACVPRASEALISSATGGSFALPSARIEQGGHSARYGRKEDVPVEVRGAGACSRQVNKWQLEETYNFEISGGEHGFGCQRVHGTHQRPIDLLAEIRSGDTVLIPHGRHGYDLHHLNVMAGPGPDQAWLICDDPAHGWVRATWDTQDVDDRLPFGESR